MSIQRLNGWKDGWMTGREIGQRDDRMSLWAADEGRRTPKKAKKAAGKGRFASPASSSRWAAKAEWGSAAVSGSPGQD